MNDKLKPALIGGAIIGLLSVIPVVNLVGYCCCLWAILGGVLATYLYVKQSPVPASPGDGAILGALAGAAAAVIVIVIGIPVGIVAGGITREIFFSLVENVDPSQARMLRMQMAGASIANEILSGVIWAVLIVIFSTLGGLLGVPIFEKRKRDGIAPPPPQTFDGGPGSYGSGM